jgi:light-regulated signal transduction histidine kinase (bacteriophytochrome)
MPTARSAALNFIHISPVCSPYLHQSESSESTSQAFRMRSRHEESAGEKWDRVGLAVVRKIVEGNHGSITAESALGAETSFALRIPSAKRCQP